MADSAGLISGLGGKIDIPGSIFPFCRHSILIIRTVGLMRSIFRVEVFLGFPLSQQIRVHLILMYIVFLKAGRWITVLFLSRTPLLVVFFGRRLVSFFLLVNFTNFDQIHLKFINLFVLLFYRGLQLYYLTVQPFNLCSLLRGCFFLKF